MVNPDKFVILSSGEAITARELAEAFWLFTQSEATYPLLSQGDEIKATVSLAIELMELRE